MGRYIDNMDHFEKDKEKEKRMFRVYLAGPITGLSYDGAIDWRAKFSSKLFAINNNSKIIGISPMREKQHLSKITEFSATCKEYENIPMSSPKGIICRDFFDATRCDLLMVNLLDAPRVSIGTMMEIAWCYQKRTPIVCVMEKEGNPHEHAFVNETINYRVDNLDEAVYIIGSILV